MLSPSAIEQSADGRVELTKEASGWMGHGGGGGGGWIGEMARHQISTDTHEEMTPEITQQAGF